jgi:hypothetical protein
MCWTPHIVHINIKFTAKLVFLDFLNILFIAVLCILRRRVGKKHLLFTSVMGIDIFNKTKAGTFLEIYSVILSSYFTA